MKTNIKVGLGLSLGAMIVSVTTIGAIERCKEKKYERDVEIARLEAEAGKKKTPAKKKTITKKVNNKDEVKDN